MCKSREEKDMDYQIILQNPDLEGAPEDTIFNSPEWRYEAQRLDLI